MTTDIRRAASRFHTDIGWLDSWHSFSFGEHFDPANQGHGQLLVLNDDRVAAGGGFGTHGHRDMEIVTWVLDGALEHRDSTGTFGVIYPGLAQRMSAGSGIRHSEMNHSTTEPVHFVQMWVIPDTTGIDPGYEQLDVNDRLAGGGLVAVASGQDHEGAIHLHQKDAVMWVGRLGAGETVTLPDAPHVHLFVARGSAQLGIDNLGEGDAARLTDAGPVELTSTADSELIVWQTA
jgi:redox-sensitive bicupin YhaK (pirin superfamily)